MKKIKKLVPYPMYDVDSISAWLEENAENGLFLAEKRLGMIAKFEQKEPAKVKYRFIPRSKDDKFGGKPNESANELMSEFGWEYVAAVYNYHLFMNYDPEAEEPYTDSFSKVESLKYVKIVIIFSLIWHISFGLLIYSNFFAFGRFKSAAIAMPSFMIGALIVYLISIINSIIELIHYKKLKNRILKSLPPEKSRKNHVRNISSVALTVLAIVLMVVSICTALVSKPERIPLHKYKNEIPFSKLEDFFEEDELESKSKQDDTSKNMLFNYISKTSSFLLNPAIQFNQYMTYQQTDVLLLEIEYYNARFDWVARKIGKDHANYWNLKEVDPSKFGAGDDFTIYAVTNFDYSSNTAIIYKNEIIIIKFSDRGKITADDLSYEDLVKTYIGDLQNNYAG